MMIPPIRWVLLIKSICASDTFTLEIPSGSVSDIAVRGDPEFSACVSCASVDSEGGEAGELLSVEQPTRHNAMIKSRNIDLRVRIAIMTPQIASRV